MVWSEDSREREKVVKIIHVKGREILIRIENGWYRGNTASKNYKKSKQSMKNRKEDGDEK